MKRRQDYTTLGDALSLIRQDVCEKNLAERLFELFEELIQWAITAIAENGVMDVSRFKASPEYQHVKEIFASSFLFDQMGSVDNAA